VAVTDAFAMSPGHTPLIPRRHRANFFELCPEEQETQVADHTFNQRR
jgi:diadenosine tetraphosphate (Ap4A) HIT family hydrolase